VAMCYYVTIRRDDLQYCMTFTPNGSHEVHDTLISSQRSQVKKEL
jgi:hypothetical protein